MFYLYVEEELIFPLTLQDPLKRFKKQKPYLPNQKH